MSNRTAFLTLEQPQNGEYVDNWEIPVNDNSAKIDAWAGDIDNEVTEARGNKTSLALFLAVGHDTTGNLLPTPEMTNSRNSPVYGSRDDGGSYNLKKRIDQGDWEVLHAREGEASLKTNLSLHHVENNSMILNGGKDGNGYPTWAGYANDAFTVDTPPIVDFLIAGYRCHLRDITSIDLTGTETTKYVYAQYQPDGVVVVDRSGDTAGVTSVDTLAEKRIFSDSGTNFQTSGVMPGDLLQILNTLDEGTYIIEEVGYGDPTVDYTKLKIIGTFPAGGLSGIAYQIVDPLAVTLGYDATEPTDADKLTISEADFGVTPDIITAIRPRHFKKTFVGEWKAVDVTTILDFEKIWDHRLGTNILDVSVQVSSANDGSQPVEELSLADLNASFTLTRTQGDLATDIGTLGLTGDVDNGTLVLTPNTPQVLTGDVDSGTLALTGDPELTGDIVYDLAASVVLTRSVKVKWGRNQIWVKNSVSGRFYKDYAGTEKTTGFIRVIIRKRG